MCGLRLLVGPILNGEGVVELIKLFLCLRTQILLAGIFEGIGKCNGCASNPEGSPLCHDSNEPKLSMSQTVMDAVF